MANSNRPPAGSRATPSRSAAGRGRRRSAPVAVSKPKPWGTIALSAVLAVVLVGLLAYAVVNQGAAAPNPLRDADKSFAGLKVYDGLKRDHVNGPVNYPGYPGQPPAGGDHSGVWQSCQAYTQQIPPEQAVHSLEHGAAWVTYRPDLPADQVKILTQDVKGNSYALLSPLPGQTAPIELTAWGRQLSVQSASDPQVSRFLSAYANGPQTPERGASCQGGSTATGATPAGAPGAMPQPGTTGATSPASPPPSTAPSATPSG